ncbi:MAG TPA: glycosyltransferase [Bacteroidales bacterium]|nr:glycosyltransferase [Bacteroidales bacterium]
MIITIAGPAWPYRGGIAEFTNRLARQLIDENHRVDIVTFKMQYPPFLFPGKSQLTSSPAPEGLKIRRLINSINPLNWFLTGLRIKKERPDILILRFWLPFMGPSLGSIARIVRSNNHTKVICIFDNVIPHEKRAGDKALTKFFTGSIDGGIVMSRSVGEDLRKFSINIPVKFNPHPLYDIYGKPLTREEGLSALNLPGGNKYLLFFGFVRAYKGLDLVIRALADPRLRNRNIKLVVAGEFYDDPEQYTELIRRLGLVPDIYIFNRFIADNEIASFFSIADIIVQPYKSATQSGVAQIGFHFGKPMLVTDVGGLREIIPHGRCGYVVSPDPLSIADSIDDFYSNDRKNAFSECVISEKKKYSWDKMTSAIFECYSEISGTQHQN